MDTLCLADEDWRIHLPAWEWMTGTFPFLGKDSFPETRLLPLLQDGETDWLVRPLSDLPLTLPDGLVLSALSIREHAHFSLAIPRELPLEPLDYFLPQGCLVHSSHPAACGQLLTHRPDLRIHLLKRADGPEAFAHAGKEAVFLLDVFECKALEWLTGSHTIRHVLPSEIVPPPGQGILACLAKSEDLDTRKKLMPLHHPETANASNLERKTALLLRDWQPQVHVFQENPGHLRGWVAVFQHDSWKKHQVSLATSSGFPEALAAPFRDRPGI